MAKHCGDTEVGKKLSVGSSPDRLRGEKNRVGEWLIRPGLTESGKGLNEELAYCREAVII